MLYVGTISRRINGSTSVTEFVLSYLVLRLGRNSRNFVFRYLILTRQFLSISSFLLCRHRVEDDVKMSSLEYGSR